jgi:conjugal transfer pilus assembly protein TraV
MKRPFVSIRGLSALAVCIFLSACANISGLGGSAEYGCKAPQGVRCDSVSGNYYNAIQNNLPTQRQRHVTDATHSSAASRPQPVAGVAAASSAAAGTASSSVTGAPVALAAPPLRSSARVLRLWFKPWEDVDHDLYDQGYVFVQIDSGRWLIDHAQQRIRDAYAPIRPPRSAALSPPIPAKPADPRLFGAGAPDNGASTSAAPIKPLPGATGSTDDDQ